MEGLPQPGDVLLDKYRIERIVGEGASGLVYGAHHLTLDRGVALKVLFATTMMDATVMDRFTREARTAAKIESPHVARVLDTGDLPGGRPFLVMELLTGADLAKMLAERGPLPIEKAAQYILQALEGVAAAHALGIVHRDLKPANLFVSKKDDGDDVLKILDFGISKTPRASRPTTGRDMLGSPSYMAPEQLIDASAIDARADLWSLGVVLYELCTNALPFDGEGVGEMLAEILEGRPVPLGKHCPRAPEELEKVLLRVLSKKPEDRYQSAAEFAAALAPFAGAKPAPRVTFEQPTPQAMTPILIKSSSPSLSDDDPLTGSLRLAHSPAVQAALGASPRRARSSKSRTRLIGFAASAVAAALVVGLLALAARPGQMAVPRVGALPPRDSAAQKDTRESRETSETNAPNDELAKRGPDGELLHPPPKDESALPASTQSTANQSTAHGARPPFLHRSD